MGCGDTVLNVATGGVSGAVESGSVSGALSSLATGGTGELAANALTGVAGNNDITKLMNSNMLTLTSGGANNIEAASGKSGFANVMDNFFDPSRVNDTWIRGSGALLENIPLGHEARGIAPAVMGAVGAMYGPAGAMAGYYFGNKIKGGTDTQGLIGGAISGATVGVGAAASPAVGAIAAELAPVIGTVAANAVAQGVVSAATSAAVGAGSAAVQGQDVGQGAASGAIGGAIGGGIGGGLGSFTPQLSQTLQGYGLSPTVANSLAGAAIKAGSSYASNQALAAVKGSPSPYGLGGSVSPQRVAPINSLTALSGTIPRNVNPQTANNLAANRAVFSNSLQNAPLAAPRQYTYI